VSTMVIMNLAKLNEYACQNELHRCGLDVFLGLEGDGGNPIVLH
jgi:hypothetical protein